MIVTVVSFILVMGVIVFVHELGHFLIAKRNKIVVEEFGFGYPPRLVKLFERNGTVYSINAIPFGGFCRMRGEDNPTDLGSFAAASRVGRVTTLLAGPAMNFLLAIVLFSVVVLIQGLPDLTRKGAAVVAVTPGSPADLAGMQPGDRIVTVDGQPVVEPGDLKTLTEARLGSPVVYGLVRADERSFELTIVPRVHPPEGQGALGIQFGAPSRRATLWEATWFGIRGTGEVIYLTFAIPANLIREGKPLSDAGFMGPVGIAATTGKVVEDARTSRSPEMVLYFMALLSAALGITNLLPLPALDGGRLLFIVVETVRGRRVEPAQEGLIHLIGFGLLLVLVGLVTIREINQLITGNFPSLGIR